MNILITGANGYIGRSLVQKLDKEHNILQIKNSKKFYIEDNLYFMNLLNTDHIKAFIDNAEHIDIIIHVASKMASGENVDDMNLFYDNIKMYEHIVQIVNHYTPKKLINFSSIAVYPNLDGEYDETSIVKPSVNSDALYGLSKFCGENIFDYMLRGKSTKLIHLRISQVFSDDLRDDRLYMVMKDELNQTNKITVYGDGKRVSNFIHKDILINKVLFFIYNDNHGIFNIGDKNLSYKKFAQNIINKFGNKNSKILFNPNGLQSRVFINIEKLNNLENIDV